MFLKEITWKSAWIFLIEKLEQNKDENLYKFLSQYKISNQIEIKIFFTKCYTSPF